MLQTIVPTDLLGTLNHHNIRIKICLFAGRIWWRKYKSNCTSATENQDRPFKIISFNYASPPAKNPDLISTLVWFCTCNIYFAKAWLMCQSLPIYYLNTFMYAVLKFSDPYILLNKIMNYTLYLANYSFTHLY